MNYQHLKLEHRGAISIITMNRPEKANALHYDHLAEIEDCALSFRDNPECRAVVLTGQGKHFSSGADLTDPGPAASQPLVQKRRTMRMGERAIRALYAMDQITIAAWTGAAAGGGACLTTAVDFRIGSEDSIMFYPEIDIGVNLMWTSLPLITHLVGPVKAKRLVIGGERIAADELEKWGIIDERLPPSQVLPRAVELAEFYASKAPVPAQMIKRSVNAIVSAHDLSIMHMDVDQGILATSMSDRAEAIRSYRQKTNPKFTGE